MKRRIWPHPRPQLLQERPRTVGPRRQEQDGTIRALSQRRNEVGARGRRKPQSDWSSAVRHRGLLEEFHSLPEGRGIFQK
jgi:hypothetical protein